MGAHQLRFVLLDKLKRPVAYEGEVRDDDDVRRLVVAGTIRGPPRRMAGISAKQLERGVPVGEFEGWHLE